MSQTRRELRRAGLVFLSALVIPACKGDARKPPAADAAAAEVAAGEAAPAPDASAVPPPPDAAPSLAAGRPERAVFRLGDNVMLAHRTVGGELVVDAGSIGFARYTRFDLQRRWRYRREVGGRRVATAERGASIEVPLTGDQAAAARGIALRLVATEDDRLTVKLGGRKAGKLAVVAGRAWYTLAIPAARFVAGENQLVIEGGDVALETLRVYADPARAIDDDPLADATWTPASRELALAEGAGLAWYVHLPPLAHLVAPVGGGDACRVEVNARADDGTRAGGLLGGDVRAVDLSSLADQAVRLELTARDCPRALLADPAVTIAGVEPAAAPAGAPPAIVILWVMDALRADRVATFTPGARAEVPAFDDLARTGAVFRQYYVVGNESQTSHATVWTGTYPAVHNVRLAGDGGNSRIPPAMPVLGELVKQAGLTTVGVTGNGFITEYGGYTRGFVEFRNMMREKGKINGVLYGKTILADVTRRIEAHKHDRTFVFVGTVDTHGPWIGRPPWLERYDGPKPYTGPFQEFGTARELGIKKGVMGCSIVPPPRDVDRLRAIYDSAISYQDQRLGELVATLQRLGLYEQTMIIVTADHGEELFEDGGRCGHGGSLRESLVRVPLLIHYPARVAPGVVDEGVDGVDVLPTILDALDAEVPRHLQGQSLLPVAAGAGRGWPRPSYASQFEYAHAMRIARWKIRVGRRGVSVVDLITDPDERVDLSGARPTARRLLTDGLGLFLATRARWHKRTMGVVTNLAPGAAELLEGSARP